MRNFLIGAQSPDGRVQKESEAQLQMQMDQNPPVFLQECLKVVLEQGTDEESVKASFMAAIQFKNVIIRKAFTGGECHLEQSEWNLVDATTQGHIKEALLSQLGNSHQMPEQRNKDTCLCLSSIAVIQVPLGQWADFIYLMTTQSIQNDNLVFKKAALQILGLFIEQIHNLKQVPENDINLVWNAILVNVSPESIEISRIVAKALIRLAPASVINFRQEAQKEKIMEGVFNLLKLQDSEIINSTLQALVEIVKLNYEHMEPYLQTLEQVVTAMIQSQSEESASKMAIEIWNSLFEAEIEKMSTTPNYFGIIRKFNWQELGKTLVQGLGETGFNDNDHNIEDEEDQTISLQCQQALSYLTQIAGDDLLDLAFQFVEVALSNNSGSWLSHYVGLLAFNGTIQGASQAKINERLGGVLGWIIESMNHQSQRVQNQALRLIANLALVSTEMLAGDPCFSKIYEKFKQVMADPSCHPKLKISGLQIICNFYKGMKKQGNSAVMSGSYQEVINHSIGLSLDQNFIRLGISIEIIDKITEISENSDPNLLKSEMINLLQTVLDQIQNDLLLPGKYEENQCELLVNNFAGLCQVLIIQIGPEALNEEIGNKILNYLGMVYEKPQFRAGSLLMVNGMVHSMQAPSLLLHLEKFLAIIEPPILDPEGGYDLMSRRMAVGLLADIGSCLSTEIVPYSAKIIELLFSAMKGSLPLEVKTVAISTLGEICLNIESSFLPYFSQSMEILIMAGKSSLDSTLTMPVVEDRRVIHEMRQAIIDSFLCIINGVKSTEVPMTQEQHSEVLTQIKNMMFYLHGLVELADLQITPSFGRQVIDLFCDIAWQTQAQAPSDVIARQMKDLHSNIVQFDLARKIWSRFADLKEQISLIDENETIFRFDQISNHLHSEQV